MAGLGGTLRLSSEGEARKRFRMQGLPCNSRAEHTWLGLWSLARYLHLGLGSRVQGIGCFIRFRRFRV